MASGSRNVAWGIAIIAVVAACVVFIVSGRDKKTGEQEPEGAQGPVPEVAAPGAGEPPVDDASSAAPAPVEAAVDTPSPMEGVAQPEPVDAVEEDEEEDQGPDRGERIADAQTSLMLNMAYNPFFDELGLDPATREEALALMVDVTRDVRMTTQQALFSGDKTAAEMKAMEDEAEAALRETLEGLLSPAELAAWDEYQDYADQILYAQLLDGQLTMLSPGLNPEGRELVKEVFAEELKLHLEAFGESDAIYSLDSFNTAQLDALLAGLERLGGQLPDDQLGHAEGFVRQVEAMFSAMAGQ